MVSVCVYPPERLGSRGVGLDLFRSFDFTGNCEQGLLPAGDDGLGVGATIGLVMGIKEFPDREIDIPIELSDSLPLGRADIRHPEFLVSGQTAGVAESEPERDILTMTQIELGLFSRGDAFPKFEGGLR